MPENLQIFAVKMYIHLNYEQKSIICQNLLLRPFSKPGKVLGFIDIETNFGSIRSIKYGVSDGRVFIMDPDFWDGTANSPAGIRLSWQIRRALEDEVAKELGMESQGLIQEVEEEYV